MQRIEENKLPKRITHQKKIHKRKGMPNVLLTSKQSTILNLSYKHLPCFPPNVFEIPKLKIINLGFNNIETIPESISIMKNLTQLLLNDNPIQNVPIELSECRKLKVLDLSNTYIKRLPREISLVKGMYSLKLDNCPLDDDISAVYPRGIVAIMEFYKDLMSRAYYREKIVKNLKEQIYVYNSIDEIEQKMDHVMEIVSDLPIFFLKRMLRNLKYLFPPSLNEINPFDIKVGLTTSKTQVKSSGVNAPNITDSKLSTMRIDDINQKIADIRENHMNKTVHGSEGETMTIVENIDEEKSLDEKEGAVEEKSKETLKSAKKSVKKA